MMMIRGVLSRVKWSPNDCLQATTNRATSWRRQNTVKCRICSLLSSNRPGRPWPWSGHTPAGYNQNATDLQEWKDWSLVFLLSQWSLVQNFVRDFVQDLVRNFVCISFVWPTSLWEQSQTKLMLKKSHTKLCRRLHWLKRLGLNHWWNK